MEVLMTQLSDTLSSLKKGEEDPDIMNWLLDITSEQYGLVNNLVACFSDKLGTDASHQIMEILRKLTDFVPVTIEQLRMNTDFPLAISQHIEITEMDKLRGDPFILLAAIFHSSTLNLKSIIAAPFIDKLLTSLPHFQNDQILQSIIFILISLSYDMDDANNMIINKCGTHENSKLVEEVLQHLINNGKDQYLEKCLQFAIDCFTNKNICDIFYYVNDVEAMVDIILSHLGRVFAPILSQKLLLLIENILLWEKFSGHKLEDIKETMKEILFSCQDEYTNVIAQRLFDMLNAL